MDLHPDYILETEDRDSLSDPTFSSTPRLAFRQPGDGRAYPRNRSGDRLPLVVELDLASEFGSLDNIESNDTTMDSARLKELHQGNGRDYKSLENGAINSLRFGHTEETMNSELPNNSNRQSVETEPITGYHCHAPKPQKDIHARNQLIIVTILCAIFMIAEVLGKTLYILL